MRHARPGFFTAFAVALSWVAVAAVAQEAGPAVSLPPAAGVDAQGHTPEPASDGLPGDLLTMERAELEALVRRLAEENAALRGGGAAGNDPTLSLDGHADADLHLVVSSQAVRIAALEAQVAALAARVDRLAPAPPYDPADPFFPPAPPASSQPSSADGQAQTPAATPPPDAASPNGDYVYTYEYGLIRTEDSEVVVLRDRAGRQRLVRVDVNEYRDDAVWVKLYFKNLADRPLRYTGLIALGGKKDYNDKRPPFLGQALFRTPVLQPGEVFDLSQEVDTDRPYSVEFVELGKVRSYPDP
ncbi:MAG: hypothetical protein AAF333_18835 [Planctomycetota bacterium]